MMRLIFYITNFIFIALSVSAELKQIKKPSYEQNYSERIEFKEV